MLVDHVVLEEFFALGYVQESLVDRLCESGFDLIEAVVNQGLHEAHVLLDRVQGITSP